MHILTMHCRLPDGPPPNADNHNLPFDCILAEIGKADGGRQMHNGVIFQGQQVYPELLIEYTSNKDTALDAMAAVGTGWMARKTAINRGQVYN